MRIVHLSDIHFSKAGIDDLQNFLLKALLNDLKKFNDEQTIDMVVISGDLIDKGGADFENITSALISFEQTFIDPISKDIDLSKQLFFFCPGNHDVDRQMDKEVTELGMRTMLADTQALNKFMMSKEEDGIRRMTGFKEFQKYYYADYPHLNDIDDFYQSSFNLKSRDSMMTVGVTCFNSAWRCYDSDRDRKNVLIGENQVIRARELISGCSLKIAVVHHPLDWLADFDQKNVTTFITKDYDLLFCGHVHEGTSWNVTNRYGSLFVSVAPSNWTYAIRNEGSFYNGYSIIDYNPTIPSITVNHRRYSYLNERFDPDTALGDSAGKLSITISSDVELSKQIYKLKMAETIEATHLQEVNEHLLTFNTDTNAPKNIDDLFVLPSIVKKVEYDVQKQQDEVVYHLSDICTNSDNILIFGIQESGKTTLIQKVLLEFTRNIFKYNKIPVFIDFDEVGGKSFETVVNVFLGIGLHQVRPFAKENQLVLLIDDLVFDENHRQVLRKLEEFVTRNPNIQIIATSKQTTEGVMPSDFLEYPNTSFSFTITNIRSFKTEQIRELIRKWFAGNKDFDVPSKLNKVFKLLTTLHLPTTPLAISMFLWIIEQQENYKPVNHATVLENFVEKLFKKSSKKQFYSEKFDYRNKEHLLADIALEMYKSNHTNYRMLYTDLVTLIGDTLRIKKFDYAAEDVLQHFLSKGILVKEYDGNRFYVRFHFTCFLEYFLMKQMSFDSEFLSYVLEEKNYLQFDNEIDYYTGIRRDQSEILKLLIERMNAEYKDILEQISHFEYGFDEVFMTAKPIIKSLNGDFVHHLKEKGKPRDEEMDKIKDEILERLKPEKGIAQKQDLTPLSRLERLWTLAARVLKNTEETKIQGLKDEAYENILRCSMAFAVTYKLALEKYLSEKQSSKQSFDEAFRMTRNVLPLLHEVILHSCMGTAKLTMVIRDKIVKDDTSATISEFERFISAFLYADIRGRDYHKYISRFVKGIRKSYIVDMSLFKIISYYYFRSHTKEQDDYYENLLADLYVHSKGLKKLAKGKVMQEYSNLRKKERIKEKKEANRVEDDPWEN
jgi:predicted MPP superfamily phosphohydrolase